MPADDLAPVQPLARRADAMPAAAPAEHRPSTMVDLLALAVERGAPIETIERLMELKERADAAEAKRTYNAAMAAARPMFKPIRRSKTAKRVRSDGKDAGTLHHETLQDIESAVGEALAVNGLSWRFRVERDPLGVQIVCVVSHVGGHSEESPLPGAPDTSGSKNTLQAIGSTMTFLQRYTLKAALGLSVSNDDDGRGGAPVAAACITDDQAAEIEALAEEVGVPLANVRAAMNVRKISAIKAVDFARVISSLEKKRALA